MPFLFPVGPRNQPKLTTPHVKLYTEEVNREAPTLKPTDGPVSECSKVATRPEHASTVPTNPMTTSPMATSPEPTSPVPTSPEPTSITAKTIQDLDKKNSVYTYRYLPRLLNEMQSAIEYFLLSHNFDRIDTVMSFPYEKYVTNRIKYNNMMLKNFIKMINDVKKDGLDFPLKVSINNDHNPNFLMAVTYKSITQYLVLKDGYSVQMQQSLASLIISTEMFKTDYSRTGKSLKPISYIWTCDHVSKISFINIMGTYYIFYEDYTSSINVKPKQFKFVLGKRQGENWELKTEGSGLDDKLKKSNMTEINKFFNDYSLHNEMKVELFFNTYVILNECYGYKNVCKDFSTENDQKYNVAYFNASPDHMFYRDWVQQEDEIKTIPMLAPYVNPAEDEIQATVDRITEHALMDSYHVKTEIAHNRENYILVFIQETKFLHKLVYLDGMEVNPEFALPKRAPLRFSPGSKSSNRYVEYKTLEDMHIIIFNIWNFYPKYCVFNIGVKNLAVDPLLITEMTIWAYEDNHKQCKTRMTRDGLWQIFQNHDRKDSVNTLIPENIIKH